MRISLVFVFCIGILLSLTAKNNPKFLYKSTALVLTENTLSDGLGAFKIEDLLVQDHNYGHRLHL